jgi:hypothetical protein
MSNIRTMVRGAYDIQKLRIQMGNRIVGNFKAKLGQEPSSPEKDLGAEEIKVLEILRLSYKKITDGVTTEHKKSKITGIIGGVKYFPKHATFKGDEIISDYTELCLVAQYVDLETEEARHFSRLGEILRDYPIFTTFLDKVRGIGPAMAGVIISEIDIHKAKYPSSLWAYAGLDVAPDGQGRSRKKEHLVERDYVNKDGEQAKRVGITFNPFLKTKLTGVLASSFLRSGNERYAKLYHDYKTRLENHEKHKDKTKGHRHNMAIRYMVKQFLVDLYREWRTLEGLEVAPDYNEAKLGHRHAA